jgi:hypothetical protein
MYVPFTTANFSASQTAALTTAPVPRAGLMRVTQARIAWAASTVGAAPIGLGGIRRPRAEATWRSAMVEATLHQTRNPRRWVRTPAYNRLDPSEKSAVSYFHGMVGARLMTEDLLRVPLLVHLDAVLAHLGVSTSKSRPDFVGLDPVAGTYSIALEAKGRSRGWSDHPLTSAKKQARLLPSVVSTTTTVTAASLMYFEDNQWVGHLEDPPSQKRQIRPLSPGLLTASYYLPIVQAMVELEDASLDRGGSAVYGNLPESGISFVVPTFIFDPLSSLPIRQDLDMDALADAGDIITASWRGAVNHEEVPEDSGQNLSLPTPSVDALNRDKLDRNGSERETDGDRDLDKVWTGLDLVTVVVNEPWSAPPPA